MAFSSRGLKESVAVGKRLAGRNKAHRSMLEILTFASNVDPLVRKVKGLAAKVRVAVLTDRYCFKPRYPSISEMHAFRIGF